MEETTKAKREQAVINMQEKIEQLESIIVQAKEAVKTTQEKNDKLQAELDKYRWIPVSEETPKAKNDTTWLSEDVDVYNIVTREMTITQYNTSREFFLGGYYTHWRHRILPEQAPKGGE